jgi:hypothetical protein
MSAGVAERYKSSIHPLLRYGLAFCAACSAMVFWAVFAVAVVHMFSWLGNGPPDTVTTTIQIYGAFLLVGVFVFLFCLLVSQLLRISSLGRWWFGTRIPSIIAILLGCAIYFAMIYSALNDTPIAHWELPPFVPITVLLISIALFTFGFMQFPFFRSPPRFSGNPASVLA